MTALTADLAVGWVGSEFWAACTLYGGTLPKILRTEVLFLLLDIGDNTVPLRILAHTASSLEPQPTNQNSERS